MGICFHILFVILSSCGGHVVVGGTSCADGLQLFFAGGLWRQSQCRLLGLQYVVPPSSSDCAVVEKISHQQQDHR
jgi:hypothetical protein